MRRERQRVAAFVIIVVQVGAVGGGGGNDGRVALLPVVITLTGVIGSLREHDDSYCMRRPKHVSVLCFGWVDVVSLEVVVGGCRRPSWFMSKLQEVGQSMQQIK